MIQIAYITDTHFEQESPAGVRVDPEQNFQKILQDVGRRGIKHIVLGGDIGASSCYRRFFKLLAGYRLDLTPGNHDNAEQLTGFMQRLELSGKKLYTSYMMGDFQFIFLNSSSGEIDDVQLKWLKEQLNTEKKVLLFSHHPILDMNTWMDKDFSLTNKQQVKRVLQESGKEIHLFCGHYHTDSILQDSSIRQVITLSAAYQAEATSEGIRFFSDTYGYRIITLMEDSVQSALIQFSNK